MPYGGEVTVRPIDPADLRRFVDDDAIGRLVEYFQSGRFTGGRFDRLAGGGDRTNIADVFTSDDVVAVSLLGVRIPGAPALALLDDQNRTYARLLQQIPVGVDLWRADEADVGPGSHADELWKALVRLPGINWVTAGKLLARKRPRLIPVYDRVVKAALGRSHADEWWRPLRQALIDDPKLVAHLSVLRDQAHIAGTVSLLRVLDVCIWMQDYGHPEPVVDAES